MVRNMYKMYMKKECVWWRVCDERRDEMRWDEMGRCYVMGYGMEVEVGMDGVQCR